MNKNFILMRDVILKYHPDFQKGSSLRKYALKRPESFNVELLVEEALATQGHYALVSQAHADFSDGSDSKTASIRAVARSGNIHSGAITGVAGPGGVSKVGALRCTIYNPVKQDLRFYFLPKSMWQNHMYHSKLINRSRIDFTYNARLDNIPKFQGYECENFLELAQAS